MFLLHRGLTSCPRGPPRAYLVRRTIMTCNSQRNGIQSTQVSINNMNKNQEQNPKIQQSQPKRYFSDNLLGYNPMATQQNKSINQNRSKDQGTKKVDNDQGPMFGVDSNTAGGGVWAQTSAKRDKLGELKLELKFDLGQRSLDDVATMEEKYDLFLIDGVHSIAKMIDDGGGTIHDEITLLKKGDEGNDENLLLKQLQTMMEEFLEQEGMGESSEGSTSTEITKQQFDLYMTKLIAYVKELKENHPAAPQDYNQYDEDQTLTDEGEITTNDNKREHSSLLHIRDFVFYEAPNPEEHPIPSKIRDKMYEPISKPFASCFEYFQIILLQTGLEHLSTQWDDLTSISSGDQDRAATKGETLSSKQSIDVVKLHSVLNAFASGACSDRVEALWNLMDKDNDGMLDQEEMDKTVYMSIKPMEDAFKLFILECMDVWPMRKWGLPPPCLEQETITSEDQVVEKNHRKKLGFYKRWVKERYEKKTKKNFLKLLDGTIKNHFDVEAETPHRLRCIYAWAEKKNQDGKTESVVVDTSNAEPGGFFSGAKKRYVELDPKISYPEFKEVQVEHFPHLDRIGQELCTSLKEDIWVHQGKGRQNQELKREIAAFLVVVSLIDYGITIN